MKPRVTFLLPVHDNAATVAATIDSILAQTFADFELLIVDDASVDATPQIIHGYRDPRIRHMHNERCLGLPETLNRGLSLAAADYIARIDADDICLPHRAKTQVAFLDRHPDVAVAGSYIETFHHDSTGTTVQYPTDPAAVAATLMVRCSLAHPSVMIRKSALDSHGLRYDASFRRAQDYDLWCRCVHQRLALANIPEVLLRYRTNPAQAGGLQYEFQHGQGDRIRSELLLRSGFDPSPRQLQLHSAICRDRYTDAMLPDAHLWLNHLARANERLRVFDPEALGKVLCGRWVRIARRARQLGIPLDTSHSPLAAFLHEGALAGSSAT